MPGREAAVIRRRGPPLCLAALLGATALAACRTVDATADAVGNTAEHAFDMPSEADKGYQALASGNNPAAIKWFSLALKDDPNNAYLKLDLAAAETRLGRFDEARALYQQVIDTAKDVVPEKVADPKLQGKSLAEIAAADVAKLPPAGSTPAVPPTPAGPTPSAAAPVASTPATPASTPPK
jgi:tetratricopeptide (TPR) repeat protein